MSSSPKRSGITKRDPKPGRILWAREEGKGILAWNEGEKS